MREGHSRGGWGEMSKKHNTGVNLKDLPTIKTGTL